MAYEPKACDPHLWESLVDTLEGRERLAVALTHILKSHAKYVEQSGADPNLDITADAKALISAMILAGEKVPKDLAAALEWLEEKNLAAD